MSDGNYTTVSVLADGEASDDNVSEAYLLADKTVREGVYTGFGLGTGFATFNTTPEEEIIFESPAPVDSALVALLYHALTTSTPVSDLGPHLIWENLFSGHGLHFGDFINLSTVCALDAGSLFTDGLPL